MSPLCPHCSSTRGSMGGREMPSSPSSSPSVPETGGGAGPGVTRAGGLSLPLSSCSAQESAPVPLRGNTVQLALVVQVRESPSWGCKNRNTGPTPCSLLLDQNNWGSAGELSLVVRAGEAYDLTHPTIHSIYRLLERVTWPTDPKLQMSAAESNYRMAKSPSESPVSVVW